MLISYSCHAALFFNVGSNWNEAKVWDRVEFPSLFISFRRLPVHAIMQITYPTIIQRYINRNSLINDLSTFFLEAKSKWFTVGRSHSFWRACAYIYRFRMKFIDFKCETFGRKTLKFIYFDHKCNVQCWYRLAKFTGEYVMTR